MLALIADPLAQERYLEDRRKSGLDRWDEVWDGMYIFMPLPNNEHRDLVNELAFNLTLYTKRTASGRVQPGCNVSDRPDDWTKNYRCPDVVVYLNDNPAEDRGSHWYGGPDLAMEIVSPGDRSRDKLDFYAAAGTRELFVLDRDPWRLELYRRTDGAMKSVATREPGARPIQTETLPLAWSLVTENGRPWVRVTPA